MFIKLSVIFEIIQEIEVRVRIGLRKLDGGQTLYKRIAFLVRVLKEKLVWFESIFDCLLLFDEIFSVVCDIRRDTCHSGDIDSKTLVTRLSKHLVSEGQFVGCQHLERQVLHASQGLLHQRQFLEMSGTQHSGSDVHWQVLADGPR